MSKITIYTAALCGFCHAAKRLLSQKGVQFDEVDVTFKPALRAEMTAKSGRTSVPQIWINGDHIGGCDDLYALDDSGKLDQMLGREPD